MSGALQKRYHEVEREADAFLESLTDRGRIDADDVKNFRRLFRTVFTTGATACYYDVLASLIRVGKGVLENEQPD